MSALMLTAYVLVWPFIASLVFLTLCVALVKDIKQANKDGSSLV
ncbi:putative transporter small subunit [Rheinheimera sp. MMS21-TC3]|nr:putative transporter small subunit [Rheinheimera sp. MMS21-TC3]WNO61312.1 putative transporter small subunit [Rheinheimera sp. MMS21-TC3]